ncbi:MAG: hypothetical protein CMF48_02550 [Legionellales bacterium]|nr:hypothetical protein [Legionellales bacterium]
MRKRLEQSPRVVKSGEYAPRDRHLISDTPSMTWRHRLNKIKPDDSGEDKHPSASEDPISRLKSKRHPAKI